MGTVTRIGRGPAGLPFSRMTLKDGRFFLSEIGRASCRERV